MKISRNRKHWVARGGLLGLLGLLLAGICFLVQSGIRVGEGEKETIRIAAIIPESSIHMKIWQEVWEGARKASEELGVRLSEYPYETGKPASLLTSLLETAVFSQVDGILLCGNTVNDPSVRQVMKEARDEGIKIVLCESDNAPAYRDTFLGLDNTLAGKTVAELLAKEKVDRVLLASDTDSTVSATAHVRRKEGLFDRLKELCPDLPIDTPSISEKGLRYTYAMEKLLLSYSSDYVGIVSFHSSQTVQMAQTLEKLDLGEKIFFIGFDEGEDTDAYVDSGVLDVRIMQDDMGMGETGLRVLVDLIQGQGTVESTIYLDPIYDFCPQN